MFKYKKPAWAVRQEVNDKGLVVDICKHGIAHPNKAFLKKYPAYRLKKSHKCDKCCEQEDSE